MSDCDRKCSESDACIFGCHADHENDVEMLDIRKLMVKYVEENKAALRRLSE